jgi:hypothetical protein
MKKSILLAAVLAAISSVAQADNLSAQKAVAVPPAKAVKPAEQKATEAVRLSDAELDQITAGKADHLTGGGLTLILNPGKAMVGPDGPKITNGNIVCINCF